MAKISIIVPVYNSEKYLNKCLDSLVNQTLQDIEIIIINDGSTDNSQNIIDNYIKKYPTKIKSFYQENSGQASSRNLGIKNAEGEFIAFVDSDDYLELDAYEKAYTFAMENNFDIVSFNFWEESGNSKYKSSYRKFTDVEPDVKYVLNETSPWNKIIRTNLFAENNIKFLDNYIYEDLELIPRLILYTNRVGFLNEYLYHYIIHPSSTMRQSSYTPKLSNIYFVMEQLKNNFQNTKYTEELEFIFIEHLLHGATLRYLDYPEGNKDIEKISNIIKENFGNWEKNKYYKTQSLKYKIICKLAFHKKIGILKLLLKK